MMKIMDYLNEEWVIPDLQGTDKASILKELSSVLVKPCQVDLCGRVAPSAPR